MWNDSFDHSNVDENFDWNKLFHRWTPTDEDFDDALTETGRFLLSNSLSNDDDDGNKTTSNSTSYNSNSSTGDAVSSNYFDPGEFRRQTFSSTPIASTTTNATNAVAEHQASAKYLSELKRDKNALNMMAELPLAVSPFKHLGKILDKEIERVEAILRIRDSPLNKIPSAPDIFDLDLRMKMVDLVFDENLFVPGSYTNFPGGRPSKVIGGRGALLDSSMNPNREYRFKEKVFVPIASDPEYNFVGRLIGPRGNTIKRLEVITGCRLLVRGKGSMKDDAKEQYLLTKKSGYEHLCENLHILVQADDDENLKLGVEAVNEMMVPVHGNDELKKRQLRELAIINGTCRPPRYSDGIVDDREGEEVYITNQSKNSNSLTR